MPPSHSLPMWTLDLGARLDHNTCAHFKVWAPFAPTLKVKVGNELLPMQKDAQGYFTATCENVHPHTPYAYLFPDGKERLDPASRCLKEGVFGPSLIEDSENFPWTDDLWQGWEQDAWIFYECHVGTYTSEGTFEALSQKIPYFQDLGITCIELMPVAQFSGRWGWGYDGVYLFAPHASYGTPEAFKRFVNACHDAKIAVCLDVVYNHFGPERCFLHEFGPYFSKNNHTPWGKAVNFDGHESKHVRHFFIQNALYWIMEYHIDILRLDAVHAISDQSNPSFLMDLTQAVDKIAQANQRKIAVVVESENNESPLIRPRNQGGAGAQAWWDEDFHHALHVGLTGEKQQYYQDYTGFDNLANALQNGVVYTGQYSSYHKRAHGSSYSGIQPNQFIVFSQNHDQVGNRPQGDRLSSHLSFEEEKAVASLLLLSPYLPLLFMGQEYGEKAPFPFFVDFSDANLMQAVIAGRGCKDPNSIGENAFMQAKLTWEIQSPLFAFVRTLISFRRTSPAFRNLKREEIRITFQESLFCLEYKQCVGLVVNFSHGNREIALPFSFNATCILHSEQPEFGGTYGVKHIASQKKWIMQAPGGAIFTKITNTNP